MAGVTLGQVCAAGLVVLEVACHSCPRRGRYRVTRLIDKYGAGKALPELHDILAGDCPKRSGSMRKPALARRAIRTS